MNIRRSPVWEARHYTTGEWPALTLVLEAELLTQLTERRAKIRNRLERVMIPRLSNATIVLLSISILQAFISYKPKNSQD